MNNDSVLDIRDISAIRQLNRGSNRYEGFPVQISIDVVRDLSTLLDTLVETGPDQFQHIIVEFNQFCMMYNKSIQSYITDGHINRIIEMLQSFPELKSCCLKLLSQIAALSIDFVTMFQGTSIFLILIDIFQTADQHDEIMLDGLNLLYKCLETIKFYHEYVCEEEEEEEDILFQSIVSTKIFVPFLNLCYPGFYYSHWCINIIEIVAQYASQEMIANDIIPRLIQYCNNTEPHCNLRSLETFRHIIRRFENVCDTLLQGDFLEFLKKCLSGSFSNLVSSSLNLLSGFLENDKVEIIFQTGLIDYPVQLFVNFLSLDDDQFNTLKCTLIQFFETLLKTPCDQIDEIAKILAQIDFTEVCTSTNFDLREKIISLVFLFTSMATPETVKSLVTPEFLRIVLETMESTSEFNILSFIHSIQYVIEVCQIYPQYIELVHTVIAESDFPEIITNFVQ